MCLLRSERWLQVQVSLIVGVDKGKFDSSWYFSITNQSNFLSFDLELSLKITWRSSTTLQLNINVQYATRYFRLQQVSLHQSLKFHDANSIFYHKVLAEHKLQHCKVISGKCFHCSESINDVNDFKQHIQSHNVKNKSTLELPLHCICCHQLLSSDFEMNLHAK